VSFNVAQRAVISYVLDLPFGKGKKFLPNASGILDKTVSGWGLNDITTLQSGFPIALSAQASILQKIFGAGTTRPNVVAGCDKFTQGSAQVRLNDWFNTASGESADDNAELSSGEISFLHPCMHSIEDGDHLTVAFVAFQTTPRRCRRGAGCR
jgi:hypothetical protein